MSRLSKIMNVSKAFGMTVLTLGVKAVDKVIDVAEVSREIYSVSMDRINEREYHHHCHEVDMDDCAEDIDQQAFAQGRESSYS